MTLTERIKRKTLVLNQQKVKTKVIEFKNSKFFDRMVLQRNEFLKMNK